MKHGRPMGKRPRARRYLVVTNGSVTECEYFDIIKSIEAHITITTRHFSADPSGLAKQAKKTKREDDRETENASGGVSDGLAGVFVVTDVDDFTTSQLRAAQATCKAEGMTLVLSNPCFEVWLIDHVEVCPGSVSTADIAKKRAAKFGLTTGRRGKELVADALSPNVITAVSNARAHMKDELRVSRRNHLQTTDFAPWTDMPAVIEEVLR